MATTETEIANRAIRLIGGNRITSLDDGSKNAIVINDLWDGILKDLMAAPWGFAETRVKLAQSASTPVFGYDYAYQLPADWLKTVSVHGDDSGLGTIDFREEVIGDKHVLVTNSNTLYLRYVSDGSNVNLWSSKFASTMVYQLASELAVPISGSQQAQEGLLIEAKRKYREARSADSLGSSPEPRNRGSWVSSRGGRG
jgi:hypothetical protein